MSKVREVQEGLESWDVRMRENKGWGRGTPNIKLQLMRTR